MPPGPASPSPAPPTRSRVPISRSTHPTPYVWPSLNSPAQARAKPEDMPSRKPSPPLLQINHLKYDGIVVEKINSETLNSVLEEVEMSCNLITHAPNNMKFFKGLFKMPGQPGRHVAKSTIIRVDKTVISLKKREVVYTYLCKWEDEDEDSDGKEYHCDKKKFMKALLDVE